MDLNGPKQTDLIPRSPHTRKYQYSHRWTSKRGHCSVGLTRARLAGARYAAGDVLVFLDAHCEAQVDWLRPQLQRIKDAPHAVVMPIIDVIESSDFYYSVQDPQIFQVHDCSLPCTVLLFHSS